MKKETTQLTVSYNVKVSKYPASHPANKKKILVQATGYATAEGASPPLEVVFLIDKSRSMEGSKIDAVKSATWRFIENGLTHQDIFSVITFSDQAEVIINKVKKGSSNLTEIQKTIKAIAAKGGTRIEKGLDLIGDKIKIDQVRNCRIILLTDGQNDDDKPINATEEIDKLKARLPSPPTIIPIGIGDGYNEQLLKDFGEQTGNYVKIHIEDETDVASGFENTKRFLAPRTEEIKLNIRCGNNTVTHNLGSISADKDGSSVVVEMDLPDENEFLIKINDSPDQKISKAQLMEDKEVLARFAGSKVTEINQDKVSDNEMKVVKLQREVLVLVSPADPSDSQYVIGIRQTILNAIDTYLGGDAKTIENVVRKITSDMTIATICSVSINPQPLPTAPTQPSQAILSQSSTASAHHQPQIPTITVQNRYPHVSSIQPKTKIVAPNIVADQSGNYVIDGATYHVLDSKVDLSTDENRYFISMCLSLSTCEAILIDRKSTIIEKHCQEVNKLIKKDDTVINKLKIVTQHIRKVLPADCDKSELVAAINKGQPAIVFENCVLRCVALDKAVELSQGFDRHEAPFTALLLADLIRKKLLPAGSVRQLRGRATNGKFGHACVTYHPENSQECYLIDASSPQQTVYDLMTYDRICARYDFACRGYEGFLDILLGQMGVLKFQAKVPETLINIIKNADEFNNNDLICRITLEVMTDPVRIEGQDKRHVFEREAIAKYFETCHDSRKDYTNPVNRKPCSNKLVPAPDIVARIVSLIKHQNSPPVAKGDAINVISAKEKQKVDISSKNSEINNQAPPKQVVKPVDKVNEVVASVGDGVPKIEAKPKVSDLPVSAVNIITPKPKQFQINLQPTPVLDHVRVTEIPVNQEIVTSIELLGTKSTTDDNSVGNENYIPLYSIKEQLENDTAKLNQLNEKDDVNKNIVEQPKQKDSRILSSPNPLELAGNKVVTPKNQTESITHQNIKQTEVTVPDLQQPIETIPQKTKSSENKKIEPPIVELPGVMLTTDDNSVGNEKYLAVTLDNIKEQSKNETSILNQLNGKDVVNNNDTVEQKPGAQESEAPVGDGVPKIIEKEKPVEKVSEVVASVGDGVPKIIEKEKPVEKVNEVRPLIGIVRKQAEKPKGPTVLFDKIKEQKENDTSILNKLNRNDVVNNIVEQPKPEDTRTLSSPNLQKDSESIPQQIIKPTAVIASNVPPPSVNPPMEVVINEEKPHQESNLSLKTTRTRAVNPEIEIELSKREVPKNEPTTVNNLVGNEKSSAVPLDSIKQQLEDYASIKNIFCAYVKYLFSLGQFSLGVQKLDLVANLQRELANNNNPKHEEIFGSYKRQHEKLVTKEYNSSWFFGKRYASKNDKKELIINKGKLGDILDAAAPKALK
jgi:uncharacterized protein YegL